MERQRDGVAATCAVGEAEVLRHGCAGTNHSIIYRTGWEGDAASRQQGNDEIVSLSGSDVRDAETDGHVFARIDNAVSGNAAFSNYGRARAASNRQLASGNTNLPDAAAVGRDAQVTLHVGNLHVKHGHARQAGT